MASIFYNVSLGHMTGVWVFSLIEIWRINKALGKHRCFQQDNGYCWQPVKMDEKHLEGSSLVGGTSPDKKFRNVFTWVVYETAHWYPFWVFLSVAVGSFWSIFKVDDKLIIVSAIVTVVASILVFLAPAFLSWWKKRLLCRRSALFASQVSSSCPGVSKEAWDDVAAEMNALLYTDGAWRTPFFFFNGQHCNAFYRSTILQPYCKTLGSEADLEIASETQSAVEYERSARLYFDEQCAEKSLSVSPEFASLPKTLYKNKFTFNSGYFKSRNLYFGLLQQLIIFGPNLLNKGFHPVAIFLIAAAAIGGYFDFVKRKFVKLEVPHRLRLLANVMNVKPSQDDFEKWDTLAKIANQWLRAEGVWKNSEELFFDGIEYKKFFEKIMETPCGRFIELAPIVDDVKAALAGE